MLQKHFAYLIEPISQKLIAHKLKLCTAESCTGGLAGTVCTAFAGSSDWFEGGIISYSNKIKMDILNVPAETLQIHGAVSLETVKIMAAGALKACSSQCALAFSGIAGPGGGTKEKPVGTVCIGVAIQEKLLAQSFLFTGDRQNIRVQAVETGLKILLERLPG